MVSLYEVTAEINGVQKRIEIVAKPEPNYFQLKSRIDRGFNLMKKDVLNEKSIKFKLLQSNLGLNN